MKDFFSDYAHRLSQFLSEFNFENALRELSDDLLLAWKEDRQVFFCGNGGSAGNAIHLANDFVYGIAKKTGGGLKAHALSANQAIVSCLANDLGYDLIFSEQLAVLGREGDILIVLSGSGNSPNIIHAIEQARQMKIKSFAVLGYSGGRCKEVADASIHFPVNDMQIAEDLQLIVGHMLMQRLYLHRHEQ